MAYHPEVQHSAAEMTLEIESVIPQLDQRFGPGMGGRQWITAPNGR